MASFSLSVCVRLYVGEGDGDFPKVRGTALFARCEEFRGSE